MATATALELCRVRNTGTRLLEGAYGGHPYSIPPGEERVLEVECAKKDFGDWDTRNLSKTEKRLQFRIEQLERLRGHYGCTPGAKIPVVDESGTPDLDEKGFPKEVLADVVWRQKMPNVEIHLMDGTRVVTVIEDPDGSDLPAPDLEPDSKDLIIASMKSDIEKLTQAVVQMQSQPKAPVDSPSAPRPRPKQAKVVASQTVED